jgi:hypothetical protein
MPKHTPDDPIGDYVDWTEHRYDSGYYLGGNVSPFLRKSRMSPRVRRLVAVPLAISALIATFGAIAVASDATLSRVMWFWSAAGAILLWWATIVMFRSGGPRRHHRHPHAHT